MQVCWGNIRNQRNRIPWYIIPLISKGYTQRSLHLFVLHYSPYTPHSFTSMTKFTSAFTALALFAASSTASVIKHRQLFGGTVTNGGVGDVFTTSSVPGAIVGGSVTNGGIPDTITSSTAAISIVTLTPTPTTTIIDIFPTDDVCSNANAMKGTYQGRVNDPVCSFLIDDCVSQIASTNAPLWSVNSCALSGACDGNSNLLQLATCAQPALQGTVPSQLPSLDYNIYAGIVGECAWAPGGCSMTRQNFIDWFYRSLDEMGTPVWPDVDTVINNWWMPIRSWTNTGESVPYLNFNDWLHWQ